MAKKSMDHKHELAHILFMSGELQKDICERVKITPKTLISWIDKGSWKQKRSARNITRTELVNKTLMSINALLDAAIDQSAEADDHGKMALMGNLGDKLSKLASFIEKLDKKSNPVIIMDVFINFGRWMQSRVSSGDKQISLEIIKIITKLQDEFVGEKMNLE